MTCRIVIPRLPERAGAPDAPAAIVDPPAVTALRFVFGVGRGDTPPTHETFTATYAVSIPLYSVGGLDPDGVYEFDAAKLFVTIVGRSLRRRWGVRVELELTQAPQSVGRADIYVDAPYEEAPGLGLHVLGQTGTGTTMPGGGRTVVTATSPVTDPKRVSALGGVYNIQLRSTDPAGGEKPSMASLSRGINVDATRFEFEG